MTNPSEKKKVGFLTAFLSILAAAFGVQKQKNMKRDLEAPNPVVYAVASLVFVLLFIGGILLVVNLVVPS